MPSRSHIALGLDVSALLLDLRAGHAVTGARRERMIDTLGRTLAALSGHSIPQSAIGDPVALIEAVVVLARDAGMSGPDLVASFNDALEKHPR